MEALNPVLEIVAAMLALLLIAAMTSAFCKKTKIPFTVMLVLVGIALKELATLGPEALRPILQFKISPEVILFVCLPTLLFESAFTLDTKLLKENLLPVLTLAIPGLLISTAIIGGIVWGLTSISFPAALLLGAILSATDPIAVISIFKQLGAPKRLTILVEGESLFNDATSVVTAKILFGIVVAGAFTAHSAFYGVFDFFIEFVGGFFVGWITALVIGFILGKVEGDPLIEISLTTLLAYFSFIIGQEVFHVSGVMATVAAGLTMGGWGRTKISPSVAQYIHHFWDYLAFIANAVIFLLVGLSVNLVAMGDALWPLFIVILGMLLSRMALIYGLLPALSVVTTMRKIRIPYKTVMYWGGLRGAIALAIVLSLGKFEYNELFIVLVTGAVLFTLLVQGLSIDKLVRLLKLDRPPLSDRLARIESLLAAKRSAIDSIPALQEGGLFSARIAENLKQHCEDRIHQRHEQLNTLREQELKKEEEYRLLFMRCFATENSKYYEMFTKGHLSERAYRNLSHSIELQIDYLRHYGHLPNFTTHPTHGHTLREFIYRQMDRSQALSKITNYLRIKRTARNYEEVWGRFQACTSLLKHLEEIAEEESTQKAVIDEVKQNYIKWHASSRLRIDTIAEQFPEFVRSMQERLADRLLVHAEMEAVSKQIQDGFLPPGVGNKVLKELILREHKLKKLKAVKLEFNPLELLQKVPFFKTIPKDKFKEIQSLLRSHIIPLGDSIITQGETGDSLFLIMRGVVRVVRREDNKEHELATLMGGDFFGEMALLHGERRNASCRAVTPCAIFELKRADLQAFSQKYPSIKEALEQADIERRQKLENSQDE